MENHKSNIEGKKQKRNFNIFSSIFFPSSTDSALCIFFHTFGQTARFKIRYEFACRTVSELISLSYIYTWGTVLTRTSKEGQINVLSFVIWRWSRNNSWPKWVAIYFKRNVREEYTLRKAYGNDIKNMITSNLMVLVIPFFRCRVRSDKLRINVCQF